MRKKQNKQESSPQGKQCEKMRDLIVWVVLMGIGFAEAGRGLHPHPIYGPSSREEMADLAGYGEEKLSTVLIIGSILFPEQEETSTSPRPVSGVRVGVTCTSINYKSEETFTDEFGDFTIDLPSHIHGTRNLHEACEVKVIQMPKGMSFAKVEKIKLASARDGVRTYTTGKIHLKRFMPETGASVASAIIRLAKLPIEKWRG